MKLLISLSAKTIILYHGSTTVFDKFSLDNSAEGAVFLTTSQSRAKRWGKVLYTVSVTYAGLYDVKGSSIPKEHQLEDIERVLANARARHCDLVRVKDFDDYGRIGDTYFALVPENVKILHRST